MKSRILFISIIIIQTFFLSIRILESKTVQEYFTEAERYQKTGHEDIAEEIMQEAIEKYPTDRYVLRYKGLKLYESGEIEEAIKVFQDAIKYNPDYADGYVYLGQIMAEQKGNEAAKEYFMKAIEFNHESRAHGWLGGYYYTLDQYNKAEEELNLYLKYNEPTDEVYLLLGDVYTAQDKYREALAAYNNAQKVGEPTFYETLLKIAQTYEKMNEWIAANKTYKDALKWHRGDKELLEGLNRTEQKIKELGPILEPKGPVLDYKGYKDIQNQPASK